MGIYRGAGGTGDAVADSSSEALLVRNLAIEVQADADAAAASAAAALVSQNSAATSATNASNSATAAASSASTASTQATNASNSASAASTSATNAATSATAAQTAETNAETAETNAVGSATLAQDWAIKVSGPVSGSDYSSKYNANLSAASASSSASSASAASTSATNASNSASAAATSATNAASSATSASGSASTAATQATNASNSASAAATSETNAAASATTAATQAGLASTSATNASNSASAASTSASNAATSATNASNSASAASTSATNASNSATAAASSATSAAASYDSFDDRYLGPKASAPTVDNDGNTLLVGALYFNTVDNAMKVWSGTIWLNSYASLSGALLATNNLSDLTSASTARTNLGLGTAATTASTDYATAAQGTKADNALTAANPSYTGTLTGGTGVVNLGSGQFYKDASGNVGIGTSTAVEKLTVSDSGITSGINLTNTGTSGRSYSIFSTSSGAATVGSLGFYDATANAYRMVLDSSGNLLLGTTAFSYAKFETAINATGNTGAVRIINNASSGYTGELVQFITAQGASSGYNILSCYYAGGGAYAFKVRGDGVIFAQNTTVQSASDLRFKENIKASSDGLNVINQLRPVRYDLKEGNGVTGKQNQLGFIAQEVQAVFPEAVDVWGESDNPDKPYLSLGTSLLIPVLVKAVQELKAELDATKAEVAALKAGA